MKVINYITIIGFIAVMISACKKDDPQPFDEVAQFRTDTTAIRKFITENDIDAMKDPETGIFYLVETEGTGDEISLTDSLTVLYEGRFLNGNVFVSTEDEPQKFALRESIVAWQAMLPKFKQGTTVRLLIPSFYAYGPVANNVIPANSILDFTVQVLEPEEPAED